ncbi:PE-PPE domain-containing protein [Nocardia sp. NPDC056100]|uniref:PE-PPE domain-containing protein n=1 Tax=Nocardia sp. NPDC056100 TaxID=3345712 RepID=UPI0035DBF855
MIDVLIVGGTGVPYGESITDTFSRTLDHSRFAPRMVLYPADYGLRVSYAESSAAGKAALLSAISDSANRVVIAGYSQGAAIAGDVAAEIGRGLHPDLEVLACALIADPLRPAGQCITRDPGDPITALPAGNPLRTVADLTQYFCISSPEAALRWGQSLVDAVLHQRVQRWWAPKNWSAWSGALAYARGYLTDGRHTDDYVRQGHAALLATIINREVA